MNVRYVDTDEFWHTHDCVLRSLILSSGSKKILDVGGGANPALDRAFLDAHCLDYTVLDISAAELDKAGNGYKTFAGDITDPRTSEAIGGFDLIFSKMVAEHVRDGRAFHENVFRMLRPGGLAFHWFPTLYCLPLVVNYFVPESVGWLLRKAIHPATTRNGNCNKFPAYYSWCRGPSAGQIRRLQSVGFKIVEYVGGFGHGYYHRIPVLRDLERRKTKWLEQHPIPWATSNSWVVLQKPSSLGS